MQQVGNNRRPTHQESFSEEEVQALVFQDDRLALRKDGQRWSEDKEKERQEGEGGR